jgi:hypothetical protein
MATEIWDIPLGWFECNYASAIANQATGKKSIKAYVCSEVKHYLAGADEFAERPLFLRFIYPHPASRIT